MQTTAATLAPRKPLPLGTAFRPSPSRTITPSDLVANAAKSDELLPAGESRAALELPGIVAPRSHMARSAPASRLAGRRDADVHHGPLVLHTGAPLGSLG